MKNVVYKLTTGKTMSFLRIMFAVLALTGVLATSVVGQGSTGGGVVCSIITVYNSVVTAIFVIGLMLMILGGALYAGSHLMPGSSKGTMQGYGMGMVLGGVIGIIIAVLAPFIFTSITGNTTANAITGANAAAGGC